MKIRFAATLAFMCIGAYGNTLDITEASATPYSGTWASSSVNVPAVNIETTDPVTLENCAITGPGLLIKTVPGAQVTLENCTITGLDPKTANLSRPQVFDGTFRYLVVEHNHFIHTAGMSIWNMAEGDATSLPSTSDAVIRIRYNDVEDVDGRLENGGSCGVFLPLSHPGAARVPDDHCHINFAGIVGFLNDPNIEIAWNQIINQPDQSASEDVILIMSSSGASANEPILIHDNYIQGVYGSAPASPIHYGGSGINTGDYLTRLHNPQYVSAFVHTFDNQIVGPSGWGICLVAGHDIVVDHNRVMRTGFLPDGTTPMLNTASGLMMVDLYKLEPNSTTPVSYDNAITNNTIAYLSQNPKTPGQRFDYELYGAPGKPNLQCIGSRANVNQCCTIEQTTVRKGADITCSPNTNAKTPDEANELKLWKAKLQANHVTLGPENIQ